MTFYLDEFLFWQCPFLRIGTGWWDYMIIHVYLGAEYLGVSRIQCVTIGTNYYLIQVSYIHCVKPQLIRTSLLL